MSAGIKYVTDASFEQDVLKSDKPVLLDFWAEWSYLMPALMKIPYLDLFSELFNYVVTTLILAISGTFCSK